jgi:uncharacterized protein YutE (UPF0331/DUF86 family)
MVDKEILDNLCVSIRGYLRELYEAQDIDWHKFIRDNRSRRFVERVLQIIVEAMVDAGQHIIADEGFRAPNTYRDVFRILCENNVLPHDKMPTYERIAAFRNILVHHYEGIEQTVVFSIFSRSLPDIEEFLAHIQTWAEQK